MKIAAFVDSEGNTLSFDSSGIVLVYEKNYNDLQWRCVCKVPFYINKEMNLADIRKSIYTMASGLEGCKAFIAKRGMGIFNAIFEEELHIRIFSVKGSPLTALDQVRDRVRTDIIEAIKKAELCKQQNDSINPIAIGDSTKGCYQINLVKVQEKNESMNSKDILLPFFEKNKFVELEIICLHTPKWIEKELGNLNFKVKTEVRKDGLCHAFVYPDK
ncbi:Fe-only nitrogenase accessory AnfO family protein [Parabacteroides sp. Marseille-P3160]|uniref:Fe-only nitrogenase accessory AnfO family protein n=1 Tax=Parabacteroides sp. Marseille-P3160 TaxID=1917887 RepID=UPI0009B95CB6|nr:Fe-only nitrogenase accessory AnfO family protein [Parabacteroides sp. Marseille-P3160]